MPHMTSAISVPEKPFHGQVRRPREESHCGTKRDSFGLVSTEVDICLPDALILRYVLLCCVPMGEVPL